MTILTLTEASRATGVARSTLYGYIQRGKLNVTSHPRGGRGVDTVELEQVFGPLKQTEAPQNTSVERAKTTKKTGTTKKARTVKKKVDVSQKRDEAVELLHQQVKLLEQELANVKERLEVLEQRSLKPPKGKRRKGKKKGR
jgi:hypothetical protein